MKKRSFSGIQPTGKLHLGNYLGAIKNWVKNQGDYENIYCVVNSHAITVRQDPKDLQKTTKELLALLLACGLDSKQSRLFIQSRIDYHAALAWILNCNIPLGDMQRMTQFKDKSQKNPQNINVGLFSYPGLMAADILLYQSDVVPIGEDQKQHLELARDVAIRFNDRYGNCFKIPEPLIPKVGARIKSLDNPSVKMSKSASSEVGIIYLLDSKDAVAKKIKKAITDSDGVIAFDENRLGVYNLLCIYECLTSKAREEIEGSFRNYGELKAALIEAINSELAPIQREYEKLVGEADYLERLIAQHEDAVRSIASDTYSKAKSLVGLI